MGVRLTYTFTRADHNLSFQIARDGVLTPTFFGGRIDDLLYAFPFDKFAYGSGHAPSTLDLPRMTSDLGPFFRLKLLL